MSFGYSSGANDYCCMDPHQMPNYVFHPSNQPLLRPVLPSSTTLHSSSSLSNDHSSHKTSMAPQPLADAMPKQMYNNVLFSGANKNPHLNQFVPSNKDVSSCLASLGHERVAQHAQGVSFSKDKAPSKQFNSLVSDILCTDLQYHVSSDQQQQQQEQQLLQNHHNVALPVPFSTPPPPKRKRNRKNKEPHQRKIKPAGTHLPREEIKRRRCRGDAYTTRTGKLVNKKVFQMVDCNCRRKCSIKVPKEVRKKIFDEFHGMADWNSQTQFIVSSVVVTDVKRKSKKLPDGESKASYTSRRATSRVFYLTSEKIQVCKPVFMSTLGITGKRVDYALRFKAIPLTAIATPDRRGRKEPKNKTSIATEARIKAHINSFSSATPGDNRSSSCSNTLTTAHSSMHQSAAPSLSSSAAASTSSSGSVKPSITKPKSSKSSTTQLHLPADLTITKMYQMYQDQCEADGVPAASMWVYTKILHAESKFRSAPHRSQQSSQASSTSCKCCDRSYAILMSGEAPEKIIQQLLEEHHQRILSSSTLSNNCPVSSASSLSSNSSSSKLSTKTKKKQMHL
ncbi:hypothetical protein PoB_002616500 [Plakobranchus ocellatus]|uniref:Uncharacterized protein n=1 Tax=Plakobranchus ocellatus TaxID=259542 RepID=A0AAV3ZWU7_9GAST|nr:hypothetical protein PoB_002616500 [Plakobranchus ocellatus]